MTFTGGTSLEQLRQLAEQFANDRDWARYHSPRNLLLALVSEVGEAADIVRWAGDQEPSIAPEDQQAWADELADILILLIRLADRSNVDLNQAFHRKLAIAAEKYPADEFRGSSDKYNKKRRTQR